MQNISTIIGVRVKMLELFDCNGVESWFTFKFVNYCHKLGNKSRRHSSLRANLE